MTGGSRTPDGALPPTTWTRAGLEPGWCADVVALDVDGVLMEVTGSFREAVRETVARVARALGCTSGWRPTAADITALKGAGGFNDDIDVSIALVAVGLAGRERDLPLLCAAIDAAGGGLGGLRIAAPDLPRVAGRRVLEVFAALYWGDGGDGTAPDAYIHRERLLASPDLPAGLRDVGVRAVAVISGRTPRELDAALVKLCWPRHALDSVVTGDMVRKPDPACLDAVIRGTGARRVVYVGDVRDDWELVRRYRAERPPAVSTRAVLVGTDAEVGALRRLGCDATVTHVADLLSLLRVWAAPG